MGIPATEPSRPPATTVLSRRARGFVSIPEWPLSPTTNVVEFIDDEETSFEQGLLVVLGWFALLAIVEGIAAYYPIGI